MRRHRRRRHGHAKQTTYQRSRAASIGHWAKKDKRREQLRRMGYTPEQIERIIKRGY